ncbi:MAG: CSLREA domain-containing protein [Pyrinomonadaceae bacterium]
MKKPKLRFASASLFALLLSAALFHVATISGARHATPDADDTSEFSQGVQELAPAATYVVDTTADTNDADTADGLCLDSAGFCSLRAAIQQANADPSADAVNFLIVGLGTQTINVGSTSLGALPAVVHPLTIDGYTQPGSSQNTLAVGDDAVINVELNGTSAGAGADGLNISAGGSTVRGLAVYKFAGDGIDLNTNGGNIVAGNFIGTNATGAGATNGNAGDGVNVAGVASNTVGGPTPAARNLISANAGEGIDITGTGATGNTVAGNYVGTDRNGTADLGNAVNGLRIAAGAQSNTVGGLTTTPGTAPGNVIGGNASDGVEITGTTSSSNTVRGNLIGLNAGGTAVLRNDSNGVFISNAASNIVGGATATARNVITGGSAATADGVDIQSEGSDNNVVAGNYIGTDINGTGVNGGAADFGAGGDGVRISGGPDNNTVGGNAATPGGAPGNLIAGNGSDGVEMTGGSTTGNAVHGNLVGTQANGATAYANGANGVLVGAATNAVGGSTATPGTGLGNVISGNGANGVGITADSVNVNGNLIGLRPGGTAALGNGTNGVHLNTARLCNVGGATADLRNVISGNGSNGVLVNEGSAGPLDNNTVAGNYVGTDITGALDLGNTADGVRIDGGDGVTVGGLAATAGDAPGNVISGNNSDGVELVSAGSNTNTIRGNLVGLAAGGTAALANAADGVHVETGVATTTVGGAAAGARNVISGNGGDGVEMAGGGHTVQGNLIGTRTDGTTALGNAAHGVHVSATNTTADIVGGTTAGAGNTIAFNGGDGVFVPTGFATVRRNSIHSNAGLGIDLGADGVTPNDAGDADAGGNNLQNFPFITTAVQGSTVVTGTLNATPSPTFTVELFSRPAADPTGSGEG